MMLTAEKPTDSMGSMMKNQFFGEVSHSSDDPKECAMMGLIRNQKFDLEERLSALSRWLLSPLKILPRS